MAINMNSSMAGLSRTTDGGITTSSESRLCNSMKTDSSWSLKQSSEVQSDLINIYKFHKAEEIEPGISRAQHSCGEGGDLRK